MKMERTKNATRNIISGVILKMYQIIAPFIIRTIMIYLLGVEYVGLNSLFTSILQVLNLTELGVGTAMVYSMYKPIAEDDNVTICALLRLYKIYYRIIGIIVLIVGVIILPFIPKMISGDVPDEINVFAIYGLTLASTIISYWLFAYKNSLLTAHQRTDVINKITTFVSTLQYILQVLVLFVFRNYYAYLIITFVSQAMLNIVIAIFAKKMYPSFKPEGKLSKENIKIINHRVGDLFTSKLGGTIVNSADTIVISTFLGLSILGIYNNYYYILNSILGFIMIIFGACTAGIGNSLIVDTEEKNLKDLNKLTFLIAWIGCVVCSCFLCLYQPFMKIWVGEKYLLSFGCVICIVVYFYIRILNQVLIVYKDAAGMWHEDRFRPLITAMANLIMNVVLVQFIGIYGVLLSTVLSTVFIGMPWVIHNLFTVIFKHGKKEYIKNIFCYSIAVVFICSITYFFCNLIPIENNILIIVYGLILSLTIPNLSFVLLFRRTKAYKETIELIDKAIGTKIEIIHKFCKKLIPHEKK